MPFKWGIYIRALIVCLQSSSVMTIVFRSSLVMTVTLWMTILHYSSIATLFCTASWEKKAFVMCKKGWDWRGILGILTKFSLNLNPFPPIPPNLGEQKFEILMEKGGMSVPSKLFHSLSFKLSNKEIDYLFPPLKLPNKGREEYSKNILFISFHSILFTPPK